MANFWQRTLEVIGLTTKKEADSRESQRAKRAYEAGFEDAQGNDDPQSGTIAAGGYGYRVGGRGRREFVRMSQDKIIETMWNVYQSNGIAKRAEAFRRSAILGRDTSPNTEDEELQTILDAFWNRNLKYNRNLKRFLIAHSLFGELILPVFVRKTDGRVLLGYIDQAQVEEVCFHPNNNLERWIVKLKQDESGKRKVYRIIREDEGNAYADNPIPPKHPGKLITHSQAQIEEWENKSLKECGLSEYTGSCFYFDKNNLPNQSRGFSDFLQSADWLDQNDEVLFALADQEQFASYFSWDVAVPGDPDRVEERASRIRKAPPVGKGQINIHSENEKWTFNSPDLKQPGSIAVAAATKTQALEGLGQPRHWHGEDDTANRATAESADNPVNRNLEHEQSDLVEILMFMLHFVRDQAEIGGYYKPQASMDNKITIQVPEIVKSDIPQISQSLAQSVTALSVATMDLKVLTRQTAAKVVAKIIAEYGIDYNPDEELRTIDEGEAQEENETANTANQFLANMMNGDFNSPEL